MQDWKQAEKDFVDSFAKYGKRVFVHRFNDTAASKATSGNKAFVVAQPADFQVCLDGKVFWAEVKFTKDPSKFHFSNIQKTQLARSRQITTAGGTYLFFVKRGETDQWYAIPAPVVHNAPQKHLKWTEIEDYEYDL